MTSSKPLGNLTIPLKQELFALKGEDYWKQLIADKYTKRAIKNKTLYGVFCWSKKEYLEAVFTNTITDADLKDNRLALVVEDIWLKNHKVYVKMNILNTPQGRVLWHHAMAYAFNLYIDIVSMVHSDILNKVTMIPIIKDLENKEFTAWMAKKPKG